MGDERCPETAQRRVAGLGVGATGVSFVGELGDGFVFGAKSGDLGDASATAVLTNVGAPF